MDILLDLFAEDTSDYSPTEYEIESNNANCMGPAIYLPKSGGEPRNNIGLHESMRETPVEQQRRIWSC